ncbi:DUF1178 family protein [Azospirillum doebereinerae]|uniref:DUF1178 family protein n=1 Tax=Azospirillum doebereinerae TaxID=92933 RepID=A0A3S0WW78_9PROT|nr:DUF1178 family protein [Azospirillum doebereinerae]MCG5242759.1 DUF1178 family protein [Azospirillum doebereinerae]RUQ73673.1 DUF1178 family protein [Azospirillum doebereinerae]
MILFALRCPADHRFEAWFRNGGAYDEQAAAHQIACPVCGDTGIAKAPMAPRIAKGVAKALDKAAGKAAEHDSAGESGAPAAQPGGASSSATATPPAPKLPVPLPSPADVVASLPPSLNEAQREAVAEVMRQLTEVRRTVEKNCDYVGDRFAEEARRIHYGETDPRGIYGEASADEVEELHEEGVTFHRIPWLPRTDS